MQLVEMLNGKELSMKRDVFAKNPSFHRSDFGCGWRKKEIEIQA